ncbi:MAG TPA: SDR family NAD(P)-dependent oxidoreductase [Polyangiales bacterium]|jgi:NAD(P)-dependent dehydrogenase (short-subunit alcohol dehydrogenase family)|nr:SDR family NAD(P)-dependent oxidoreductase [Polyangiales bacterium]
MGTLAGKVVLITGAGRGLGRAAALACAHAGANVVLADLGCDLDGTGADPRVVESIREEIVGLGGRAIAQAVDVTSEDAPARLVQLARAEFGRIDGLFAAAGIVREHALSRLPDADLDRVLDVHARSAMRFARIVSAAMVDAADGGAILLASGQAAFVGQRGQAAYCAAASAITGFVRAAALELRRHHIRVNALAPTARTRATENTPMFQSLRPDSLRAQQVAQAVVFLLSPLAGEVSGECVGVAGNRVYSLRLHETAGAFLDDAFTPEELAAAWTQVTR